MKSSQKQNFVTAFYQKHKSENGPAPDFWILYQFIETGERLFVLSHLEICKVQEQRNTKGKPMTYAQIVELSAKGVVNVLLSDVVQFENQWTKILNACNNQE